MPITTYAPETLSTLPGGLTPEILTKSMPSIQAPSKQPSIFPTPIIAPAGKPSPVDYPYKFPQPMKYPAPEPITYPELVKYPTPTKVPQPVPEPEPYPQPQPETAKPPPPDDKPPTKIAILPPPPSKKGKPAMEATRRVKDGTIIWRHGAYWEVLEPPYDKVVHMKTPPPGTYKFATGKGSAAKTVQVLPQGARIPSRELRVDLGWAEAIITSDMGEPRLKFKGHSKGRPAKGTSKKELAVAKALAEQETRSKDDQGSTKRGAVAVAEDEVAQKWQSNATRQTSAEEYTDIEEGYRDLDWQAARQALTARPSRKESVEPRSSVPASMSLADAELLAATKARRSLDFSNLGRRTVKKRTAAEDDYGQYYLGRRLDKYGLAPDLSGAV
jgi:hypothetical protein